MNRSRFFSIVFCSVSSLALWRVVLFGRRACSDAPFERVVIDADFPGGYQVEVADVNGDGRPDVDRAGRRDVRLVREPVLDEAGRHDAEADARASSAARRPTSTATARPRSPSPTSSP